MMSETLDEKEVRRQRFKRALGRVDDSTCSIPLYREEDDNSKEE